MRAWPGPSCSLASRADADDGDQHGDPSCARGFFMPRAPRYRSRYKIPWKTPDFGRGEQEMSDVADTAGISETASRSETAIHSETASDVPPHRYTAALAGEI